MRYNNWSQPVGSVELNEFFDQMESVLKTMGMTRRFDYKFYSGCIDDCTTQAIISRPSYNLIIYYGEYTILAYQYELDVRFSLEVTESEVQRIEDLLANKVIATLGLYGVLTVLKKSMKKNEIHTCTVKESDDKNFLPLN